MPTEKLTEPQFLRTKEITDAIMDDIRVVLKKYKKDIPMWDNENINYNLESHIRDHVRSDVVREVMKQYNVYV